MLDHAGYIQITADQKDLWDSDANAFVADEENDMMSVRTSGQLVLDELLQQADGAAGMLAGAVRRRLDEAAHAKVRSLPHMWWLAVQPLISRPWLRSDLT